MIEKRKGKNPNTDQGRMLEVFMCSAFEFYVYIVFDLRKNKTLLFVNQTLMMT